MSTDTCVVTNARRRTGLTAGQFVQEGRRQDVINHPSGQEERQVIFCAGHIQLEIIHTVQQALEALLHLISLDDLVVQAGQQVCCHLMLPEEPEEQEEEKEEEEEEEALVAAAAAAAGLLPSHALCMSFFYHVPDNLRFPPVCCRACVLVLFLLASILPLNCLF